MALKEVEYKGKLFNISYEIINPSNKRDIIFLHGWGSNKEIMKVFTPFFKDFRHIYIDLPGFGKSSNDYILDSYDYKEIVNLFLSKVDSSKDIIVGHSFGGKVATLLQPELLVLLASAGIVMPKPLDVRLKIAIYKALKPFGIEKFRKWFVSGDVKGMSKEMYETFKNVVDEDFRDVFAKYNKEAVIFGGTKDSAVPKEAVEIQGELLKKEPIFLEGGHYFFFNDLEAKINREIIEREVLKRV